MRKERACDLGDESLEFLFPGKSFDDALTFVVGNVSFSLMRIPLLTLLSGFALSLASCSTSSSSDSSSSAASVNLAKSYQVSGKADSGETSIVNIIKKGVTVTLPAGTYNRERSAKSFGIVGAEVLTYASAKGVIVDNGKTKETLKGGFICYAGDSPSKVYYLKPRSGLASVGDLVFMDKTKVGEVFYTVDAGSTMKDVKVTP